MKPTIMNIKISLLVSTIVFASDIGPLHPFLPVIATASALLFGVTSWLLFMKNQEKPNTYTAAYMGATALLCFCIALITFFYIMGGMTEDPTGKLITATSKYDAQSTALLLGAIIMNIAGLFLLKEK